ncbi:MAG TPA: ATP-binding protein [Cyclobacteriaceae bacterium]|nr:ATP-binding protein [Cyclobacteriaceae bacterium]
MDIELGIEVINSYKRLSYKEWYALAEFVDNSTQAYADNKKLLDESLAKLGKKITISIDVDSDAKGDFIRISDNSIGMSKAVLEQAVIIGKPPVDTSGRNKYGLGMKTAACWLGDYWTVKTKTINETIERTITVDVPIIAKGNKDLHYTEVGNNDPNEHYTIIEIRNLHRNLRAGRTSGKIRNYLMSMYRFDIESGLRLLWQGEELNWDRKAIIESRLIERADGTLERENLNFTVGGKRVTGWVGVFEKGSRKDAGFSIIQSKRVIVGWPDSFRPDTLFGAQEGGSNDLVNQRLVGELFMDGFDVSHTKDEILYKNDEYDELESKLLEQCSTLRKLALSYRKYQADEREPTIDDCSAAIAELEIELRSNQVREAISTYEVPSLKLINESNDTVKGSVMKRVKPTIKSKIGEIEVWLYVVDEMSPFDPYVIIESTKSRTTVVVIVNKSHPHWKHLNGTESILNFLRHCTYDGVSEWKAYFKAGRIDPDTIKMIKDNLLRAPFEIQN